MISIIIPAYNAAQTLPLCLAALHRQTLPPDEIIVVDDGSEDQTIKVARENGVQVLEQPHQGPAAARNRGINNARCDIVLFIDADCEPVTEWVAEMLKPFSNPGVVGVKGSYRTRQKECVALLVQCEFEDRYDRLEQLPTIDFIDTYAAGFRIAVLRDKGGFVPFFTQNEDVELSYRLADAGCRLIFNRQAVVYHQHPSTWCTYLRLKIKRGYWRIMAYRLHPDKVLRDSYTPQLLKVQIAIMYLLLGFSGLAFVYPPLVWGVVTSLICLCISAIPFVRRAVRQDNALLLPACFFIFVRALAFTIGVTGGIVGMIFFTRLKETT
jgi:glycosyltransferase involved in cell wall biosynthesis